MVNLSSLNNPTADRIIYDNSSTNLSSINVEGAINEIYSEVTTSSGSGSFSTTNVIYVDPANSDIEGSSYNTWQKADTYVQTQSPSDSNRWIIKITGTNNEDIVLREYVTILGIKDTTILNGKLSSSINYSFGMDTTKARVVNCIINDLDTSSSMEFIQFVGSTLKGGTPSSGFVQVFDGAVNGGDYSSLYIFQLFTSMVTGGVLSNSIECMSSDLYNNYTLQGGKFTNCLLMNQGNITISIQGNLSFDRSKIEYSIDVGDYILTMDNCVFKNNPTFTISNNGSGYITNCSPGFNIAGPDDGWTISGNYYFNKNTGLDAADSQKALDLLATGRERIDSITTSSGILSLDMDIPNYKLTLTEDVSSVEINTTFSGITSTNLYITQGSSQNYTVTWSGIYFSDGTAPDLSQGSQSKYVINLTHDGSSNDTYGFLAGSNMSVI